MRDCDCGTCCEQCGHLDDCVRHELAGAVGWDVAAQVAAEDGWPARQFGSAA